MFGLQGVVGGTALAAGGAGTVGRASSWVEDGGDHVAAQVVHVNGGLLMP